MKTITLTLFLILLVAMPAAADQPTLRYKLAGTLQLSMEQDMYPNGSTDRIADRRFDMTFEFVDSESVDETQAELAAIKATYTAHGMNQILSTRHLVGQQVPLRSDGKTVNLDDPGGDIDLGSVTDGGFYPAAVLVDLLPVLPDGPVSKGMTWETRQSLHSLEGWAWAEGNMLYSHKVTGITQDSGRTIVQVKSHGKTTTAAAEGREGFVGEGNIERRMNWTFDATTGQLLSLSLKQKGTGTNQLPQGRVRVRQVTSVELNGA